MTVEEAQAIIQLAEVVVPLAEDVVVAIHDIVTAHYGTSTWLELVQQCQTNIDTLEARLKK